jgi:glycine/D-amino acid oxidase-like deaminating enzyme
LEEEYAVRRRAGIDVDFLSSRDIQERFSFHRPAALLSHLAGEIDAFRLTHKLIAAATRFGLEAYDRTGVSAIETHRDGVELQTANGCRSRLARWCLPPVTRRRSIWTRRS